MDKLKAKVKQYLNTRNVLVVLLFLIASLLWSKYIIGILLVVIFTPITIFMVRYSKFIPHVTAECNTALACFTGFIFGPVVGFFYGVSVGGIAYIANSLVTPASMSTVILAGVSGAIVGILSSFFGMGFVVAYVIAVITRTILGLIWFPMFADPIEVFTHQFSQLFVNLIFYLPLLLLIRSIIMPFI
jgi:hypothetical protein